MRTILTIGLLLVSLPVLVISIQVRRAQDGVGARADYLEIEPPPVLASGDPALGRGGIPVLCYHYLSPRPGAFDVLRATVAVVLNLPTLGERHYWSLPADTFESHLRWLQQEGYTSLTGEELVEILRGERRRPRKAVCITFDDGDRSLLDHGLPLLREYDMKATLFVVTARVGQKWEGIDMMNWGELRELQDSGHVSIQSHTHDMHYKVNTAGGGMEPVFNYRVRRGASPEEIAQVRADLKQSRAELKRNLGVDATLLAWPYGFGNGMLDGLARQTGFEASFSLRAGAASPGVDSPWHVRRFTLTSHTTLPRLEEMVEASHSRSPGFLPAR